MTTTVLNTKISEADNKMLDSGSLMTTIVLNTKISEVENKFLIMLNILLLKNLIS